MARHSSRGAPVLPVSDGVAGWPLRPLGKLAEADTFLRFREIAVRQQLLRDAQPPRRRSALSRSAVDREQVLAFNEKNIAEFRRSGGRLSSFGDAPVLLLTSTGAQSGQRRTNPMMYLADDRDPELVYVFASAAGADENPAWYHNVVAHPDDLVHPRVNNSDVLCCRHATCSVEAETW